MESTNLAVNQLNPKQYGTVYALSGGNSVSNNAFKDTWMEYNLVRVKGLSYGITLVM